MPASSEDVHALAERLCALLNDCMDAGVTFQHDPIECGYTLAAGGYSEGWKYRHQVTYSDADDYWDVRGD